MFREELCHVHINISKGIGMSNMFSLFWNENVLSATKFYCLMSINKQSSNQGTMGILFKGIWKSK